MGAENNKPPSVRDEPSETGDLLLSGLRPAQTLEDDASDSDLKTNGLCKHTKPTTLLTSTIDNPQYCNFCDGYFDEVQLCTDCDRKYCAKDYKGVCYHLCGGKG